MLLLFSLFKFFQLSFAVSTSLFLTMKHRSDNPMGAAVPLNDTQLPTHGDVGRQWRQSRMQMESEHPGKQVANREVAKRVN